MESEPFMDIDEHDLQELVEQGRLGDKESLNRLAQLAQSRLWAYVYRVTLDRDLADDLCQETLLKMVSSLPQLRDPRLFWSWLFRIATSRIQQHYRECKRKKVVQIEGLENALSGHKTDEY